MVGLGCSIATLVVGAVLLVVSSIVGYGVVPGFIESMIIDVSTYQFFSWL